ncbi:MAG: competence/damage-inducible protein A [Pyrinomonadaceae bacterium]
MVSAEIIAVGSELLTPEKSDTNSLWITDKLNLAGIEVVLKTIVGDDREKLSRVVSDALSRTDVVVVTGGLGPTEDDITREGVAVGVGRELVFRQDLLDELRERFKQFGYEMPETNRRQAYVIDGAEVLHNPNGSAPGMLLRSEGKLIGVLPGPPREMRPMFEKHVLPAAKELSGDIVVLRRSLRVNGLGESKLDEMIAPIYTKYTNPATSTLFSKTDIEIQFTARAESVEEADSLIETVSKEVCDVLGDAVYSTNGEDLEVVVGRMLNQKALTLALAESCTGGLIATRLTDVPGASGFLMEGLVTYSNGAKIRRLGVPESTIDAHGAVSSETAEAMASGARESSGVDVAVSVTGIAGPDGGTEDKPVGTVFVGLSDSRGTISKRFKLIGDREMIRWRSSQAALEILRRRLLEDEC